MQSRGFYLTVGGNFNCLSMYFAYSSYDLFMEDRDWNSDLHCLCISPASPFVVLLKFAFLPSIEVDLYLTSLPGIDMFSCIVLSS